MSEKKPIEYPGKEASVTWHGRLCIHMGECGRAEGELFVGGRKPWCDPDLASREEINDVVGRCPTGALAAQHAGEGDDAEIADPHNTINVSYNGPLFARGDLHIEAAPDSAPGLKYRAALCRCGASKNKPFCDNSHLEAGFSDYGAVGKSGEPVAEKGGPLAVTTVRNGPLMVSGNLTLLTSGGRAAWQGTRAALCRCGASANKPFCDGQHAKIGFEAD